MKWVLIGVLCLSPLVVAAEDDDWGGMLWGTQSDDVDYEDKRGKWLESNAALPPFPDFDKMIPLPVSTDSTSFKYFVDPDSFSLNEKDGISRYTVIIESRSSGLRNVLYEGIRCEFSAYRVIATGTSEKQLELAPRVGPWLRVQQEGAMAYRWSLVDAYVCDAQQSVPADEIASRIQYDRPITNGFDENY